MDCPARGSTVHAGPLRPQAVSGQDAQTKSIQPPPPPGETMRIYLQYVARFCKRRKRSGKHRGGEVETLDPAALVPCFFSTLVENMSLYDLYDLLRHPGSFYDRQQAQK